MQEGFCFLSLQAVCLGRACGENLRVDPEGGYALHVKASVCCHDFHGMKFASGCPEGWSAGQQINKKVDHMFD